MILKQVRYSTLLLFPWIAPGCLAVNQTIGLPPRARDDFGQILSTLSTFLDATLADLGIWARVWQTDKRRDNLTDRRRGEAKAPLSLSNKSWSSTNPGDDPQIQDLWQSTNTGSLTIHKYRIHPDKIRNTKYSDKDYHYIQCCFTFMLYKKFIVSAWLHYINIVVGWVNEKS